MMCCVQAESRSTRQRIKSLIDGRAIDLSYKEFELLTYFMENQGIALSREKISEQCLEL